MTPDRVDSRRILDGLLRKDPSLWSDDPAVQAKIADRLGWLTVHHDMLERVPELEGFAEEVRERGYTTAVLLGMGGASLAPEVFQRTFGNAEGCPELAVLDTTDPAQILAVERSLDLAHTLFIVSTKSGTTVETLSLHHYFAAKVREATGDEVLDNFVAITDPGSHLEQLAGSDGFWRTFLNPPDVGGRYSALSYFGLVPAAVIGVDLGTLLERAAAADPADGVALGIRLAESALAGRDKITLVSSPSLASFGAWSEQLLAESTGKQGKGLIPIDAEPLGRLELYGHDRVPVRLGLSGDDAKHHRDAEALGATGHPLITRELRDVFDLGAEFLRWMIATAAAGAVLGINPFDEPNVHESKDNTNAVLKEAFRAEHVPEPEPIARSDGMSLYATGDTVALLGDGDPIETLLSAKLTREGDYIALLAFIARNPEHDALLARIRVALRDSTHLATTAGYGPRYLHSTGQLHKGGPDSGVFFQLTADDDVDLPIPGESYTFGTLKRAQALGDLRALQSRGRRVVRLHLGRDAAAGLKRLAEAIESSAEKGARR